MPSPSTSILDNFNRANGALGANWSSVNASGNQPTISSNVAIGPASSTTPVYWNPTQFGPDSEAYMTCTAFSGTTAQRLFLRLKDVGTANNDGYSVSVAADGTWEIRRLDNGAITVLNSGDLGTMNAGDVMWFTAVGSTLTFYVNGTSIATATDATYAAAGYIGFQHGNSTSSKSDDFGGGTIPLIVLPPTATATAAGVAPIAQTSYVPSVGTATAAGVAPIAKTSYVPSVGTATAAGIAPLPSVTTIAAVGAAIAAGVAPVPVVTMVAAVGAAVAAGIPPTVVIYLGTIICDTLVASAVSCGTLTLSGDSTGSLSLSSASTGSLSLDPASTGSSTLSEA